MKSSTIKKLFEGLLSYKDFFSMIEHEVNEYSSLSQKIGSTIPIHLDEDLEKFSVGPKDIESLCFAFLNNEISSYELSYLADALTLSEKITFKNENLIEVLEQLTDPETNGTTPKMVESILKEICSMSV